MKIRAPLLALTLVVGTAAAALGDDNHHKVDARLSGYNEVHFIAPIPALRGAISTAAEGTFRATIDEPAGIIHYELSYQGLEGSVTQAHIHFGQRHTVGGIVVWLCETDAAQHPVPELRRPVTPECPQSGTVTGTIGPEKVLTVTGQGIEAGEFAELLRAIHAGATYANVHSGLFPPGEIRGQIRGDRGNRP
jgi:hypothetical protein